MSLAETKNITTNFSNLKSVEDIMGVMNTINTMPPKKSSMSTANSINDIVVDDMIDCLNRAVDTYTQIQKEFKSSGFKGQHKKVNCKYEMYDRVENFDESCIDNFFRTHKFQSYERYSPDKKFFPVMANDVNLDLLHRRDYETTLVTLRSNTPSKLMNEQFVGYKEIFSKELIEYLRPYCQCGVCRARRSGRSSIMLGCLGCPGCHGCMQEMGGRDDVIRRTRNYVESILK